MATTLIVSSVSEQIVAFADLRDYHREICLSLTPEQIFEFLSGFYSVAQHSVASSGGRIVKFIGDSIMLVFPASDPIGSVDTLKRLKKEVDAFLSLQGWNSHLRIKAHVGSVAAGIIGEGELATWDICGVAVNQTALLPNEEWVLSSELQEKISL